MSGFGLTLTYDDLGVRRAMDGLLDLGRIQRIQLMRDIGAQLEATTVDRFYSGVGPDGESWEPSFRARVKGGKTLVDSGLLRDSIHYVADDDAVEIGSADGRSAIHQFGGTITAKTGSGLHFALADGSFHRPQSVTIPARPFVGLSAEDGRLVETIAEQALARALAGGAA